MTTEDGGPLPALPVGDVNIVVVTDVHSWVGAHDAGHEPSLDADYGDVLSFCEILRRRLRHRDLFFVNNGDFMDGTGLSTVPPSSLLPILEKMPWDAVNIGNHELYQNETIEYMIESGFIDHWGGNYLTSNTLLAESGLPLGSRYTYLVGNNSRTRILTFGFLYNFTNNCAMTTVEAVQKTVKEEWFAKVLKRNDFDAVLVLAHMDCVDPLVSVILTAVREITGRPDLPVQFITGHSHRRAFAHLDPHAASMEAGRFLDTIGFASFSFLPTDDRDNNNNNSNKSSATSFQYSFIDANKESLKRVLRVKSLHTPDGVALSALIDDTRQSLGLDHVVGCSSTTYYRGKALEKPDSLWRLYLEEIVGHSVTKGNESRVFMQSTGGLRYDLFQGETTVDDLTAVSPFNDDVYRICGGIQGSVLQDAFDLLGSFGRQTVTATLPPFATTTVPHESMEVDPNGVYDLFGVEFDIPRIVHAVLQVSEFKCSPVIFCESSCLTTSDMWLDYVSSQWPCDRSDLSHPPPLHQWSTALLVVCVLSALVILKVVPFRRLSAKKNDQKEPLVTELLEPKYGSI